MKKKKEPIRISMGFTTFYVMVLFGILGLFVIVNKEIPICSCKGTFTLVYTGIFGLGAGLLLDSKKDIYAKLLWLLIGAFIFMMIGNLLGYWN